MPKWDTSMEAPAIDLIGYKTTQEEIFALYHEVHQLKRAPRTVPGDPKVAEEIHQEILNSLKEHLQCRQHSTQLDEPEQVSASASRSDQTVQFPVENAGDLWPFSE